MKKTLSILLVSTLFVTSIFGLSACSQLDIAEQPDPVVIYAEKIYPSAIGNSLTDISVKVPTIDAYMEEYNKNADEKITCLKSTCSNVVYEKGSYCAEHKCANDQCSFKKEDNLKYCSSCTCLSIGCKNIKV